MVSAADNPQRIARLMPLADVLARIDALVAPVPPREVAIAAAVGRVLAGDVTSGGRARPPVPLALRDGWAVSADLTIDASSYAPAPLPAATRIALGEPMPAGTDAVAPFDVVVARSGRTEIVGPVVAGEGVLPPGGDVEPQTVLLRVGQRLTRMQAAVLAAAGMTGHIGIRAPSVRLVRARSGGDAVIAAAIELIAGGIVAAGGCVQPSGGAGTGEAELDAALADDDADAVIAVGGTGSGPDDAGVHTLARHGRLEVHGVALVPGETAAFGLAGRRPVLLLPGRIDAALAVWLLLGRSLLARLSGAVADDPVTKATLARKIASGLGLAEMIPVRLRLGAAEPIASGYVPLSVLAQSDGWILVPADSEGYPAGARS